MLASQHPRAYFFSMLADKFNGVALWINVLVCFGINLVYIFVSLRPNLNVIQFQAITLLTMAVGVIAFICYFWVTYLYDRVGQRQKYSLEILGLLYFAFVLYAFIRSIRTSIYADQAITNNLIEFGVRTHHMMTVTLCALLAVGVAMFTNLSGFRVNTILGMTITTLTLFVQSAIAAAPNDVLSSNTTNYHNWYGVIIISGKPSLLYIFFVVAFVLGFVYMLTNSFRRAILDKTWLSVFRLGVVVSIVIAGCIEAIALYFPSIYSYNALDYGFILSQIYQFFEIRLIKLSIS